MFQINGEKFPALKLLRAKETQLLNKQSSSSSSYVKTTKTTELFEIQQEIESVESQISYHLYSTLIKYSKFIDDGLNIMAQLDTIFARAAFGITYGGIIPQVENEGVIDIDGFIHPILALKNTNMVMPIDLKIACDDENKKRCLMISGPNGGGKTLALKLFGLAILMNQLGIPILSTVTSSGRINGRRKTMRIDFFDEILLQIGDDQNVSKGESTFLSKCISYSTIIQKLSKSNDETTNHKLILLDELGSGTDPESGSAIAQAIVEQMMDYKQSRVIATTHSSSLKRLSITSTESHFQSASVLLSSDDNNRRPTYRLSYDTIGNSYALEAITRCNTPPLPNEVLERASFILNEKKNEELGNSAIVEQERRLQIAFEKAEQYQKDTRDCRDAMIQLARAYETKLSRIESRLDDILSQKRSDEDADAFEIVGDTVSELRLMKKRIKTEEEILREKGLIIPPSDYIFRSGESVTVRSTGETVIISTNQDLAKNPDEIVVESSPFSLESSSFLFPEPISDFDVGTDSFAQPDQSILNKRDVAIWDYSYMDEDYFNKDYDSVSVPSTKKRIYDVLSTITTSSDNKNTKIKALDTPSNDNFRSARERKAVKKKPKKKKK